MKSESITASVSANFIVHSAFCILHFPRAPARTVVFFFLKIASITGFVGAIWGDTIPKRKNLCISMRSKEVGTSQAPPAADEAQASEWQAPCERNRKGGANGWSQQGAKLRLY